jgi:nicotinamidase-related amidase
MKATARIYRQFDADLGREVPGEGYGGWHRVSVPLAPEHTALVVMHAWDSGRPGEFPGWDRAVEYLPRCRRILDTVFPRLLATVRESPLPVIHVAGGGTYHRGHAGFQRARALAGESTVEGRVAPPDEVWQAQRALREAAGFPGPHNRPDIDAAFARLDFAPQARPLADEAVVEDAHQLAAVCRELGVNHLVYVGFALNWCLLMSPGGMVDMARRGAICSTIAEAVTAVENRETARDERELEQALWRVSVEFGFVFELDAFLSALPKRTQE